MSNTTSPEERRLASNLSVVFALVDSYLNADPLNLNVWEISLSSVTSLVDIAIILFFLAAFMLVILMTSLRDKFGLPAQEEAPSQAQSQRDRRDLQVAPAAPQAPPAEVTPRTARRALPMRSWIYGHDSMIVRRNSQGQEIAHVYPSVISTHSHAAIILTLAYALQGGRAPYTARWPCPIVRVVRTLLVLIPVSKINTGILALSSASPSQEYARRNTADSSRKPE